MYHFISIAESSFLSFLSSCFSISRRWPLITTGKFGVRVLWACAFYSPALCWRSCCKRGTNRVELHIHACVEMKNCVILNAHKFTHEPKDKSHKQTRRANTKIHSISLFFISLRRRSEFPRRLTGVRVLPKEARIVSITTLRAKKQANKSESRSHSFFLFASLLCSYPLLLDNDCRLCSASCWWRVACKMRASGSFICVCV